MQTQFDANFAPDKDNFIKISIFKDFTDIAKFIPLILPIGKREILSRINIK